MPERVIVDQVIKALKAAWPELSDEQAEHVGEEQALLLAAKLVKLGEGTETQTIEIPATFVDAFVAENLFGRLLGRVVGYRPRYREVKVTVDWTRYVSEHGTLVEPREVHIEKD